MDAENQCEELSLFATKRSTKLFLVQPAPRNRPRRARANPSPGEAKLARPLEVASHTAVRQRDLRTPLQLL